MRFALDSPRQRLKYKPIYSGIFITFLVFFFLQPILFPPAGQAAGGADVRAAFMPWLQMAKEAIQEGHLPLWDPYQFGGYPFLSNPQVAIFYPPTWLALLLPVNVFISWHIVLHMWLMGLGLLLLLWRRNAGWAGATLGAVAFTFSGFVTARVFAGHISVLATFAWLPWLLLTYDWVATQKRWWFGLFAGLPFAFAILAGHPASLLYVGLIWSMWALALFFEQRSFRIIWHMILAGVTGLALSSVQLIPYLEFALFSSRVANASFDFATSYSFPPAHLITLLMPEYFGEPTRIGYWSVPVFEEMAYYTGILGLIAVAMALRKPGRRTVLYLLMIIVGLWLALGHYSFLYKRLYDWFLPFRLARAPARAGVLYSFGLSMLLAETFGRVSRDVRPNKFAPLLRTLLIVGAVVGIAGMAATGAVFAAQHPTETSGRLWHQLGGWGWMLLMIVLGCTLLWVVLDSNADSAKRRLATTGLILLIVVDLWHFGHKMVRLEPVTPASTWQVTHSVVGNSEERVLPWGVTIFEQNGAAEVGLRSIFGYSPLAPGANEALTSSVPDPRSTAYDLFHVGYVVSGAPLNEFTEGERALELVTSTNGVYVYRRARILPLTRLVYNVEVIPDNAQAIARVHQPDFDPEQTVILSEAPPCAVGPPPSETTVAQLDSHTNRSWRINTQSSTPGVLVVSETAFPGWRVYVDNQAATSLTAYTAMRAVCVPAGDHVVTWRFQPASVWWGAALSLLTLFLCLVATLLYFRHQKVRHTSKD